MQITDTFILKLSALILICLLIISCTSRYKAEYELYSARYALSQTAYDPCVGKHRQLEDNEKDAVIACMNEENTTLLDCRILECNLTQQ